METGWRGAFLHPLQENGLQAAHTHELRKETMSLRGKRVAALSALSGYRWRSFGKDPARDVS